MTDRHRKSFKPQQILKIENSEEKNDARFNQFWKWKQQGKKNKRKGKKNWNSPWFWIKKIKNLFQYKIKRIFISHESVWLHSMYQFDSETMKSPFFFLQRFMIYLDQLSLFQFHRTSFFRLSVITPSLEHFGKNQDTEVSNWNAWIILI